MINPYEKDSMYEFLFTLQKSGAINMWGAVPVAQQAFPKLNKKEVKAIVIYWMKNYQEIKKRLGHD